MDEEQAKGLRDVCSIVARLLGQLLETDDRWNRFWWVDDLSPTFGTAVLSDHQLEFQGLIIWGQKGNTSQEWVEPCSVRLSDATEMLRYQIRCGDAARGLGKVSYERKREITSAALPQRWLFIFSK
jgi:hypothetical protein